ncbi:MAG: energy-coupling factor transporter transmembrane protein EcfT [Anaeroplasmataceae bacterium]|nr:energy-coupling factor transporter transmembrane protein EcfT [Anaeroplasmataceae bacterium]
MQFFRYKNNLYPLIAILSSLIILVFGLVMAKRIECSYFLLAVLVWLILFGCYKQILKVMPMFIIFGGIFSLIAYFSSGKNMYSALAMMNRFGAVFLALVPGMKIQAVSMTRNLVQLHTPRSITLGMLITLSFAPVLRAEIKRVREAMKTRGAGRSLSPKFFYRGFLIPLVTRLVDISDTLALSIETRGFTLGKTKFTVYKREIINFIDVMYLLGFIAAIVLEVVL